MESRERQERLERVLVPVAERARSYVAACRADGFDDAETRRVWVERMTNFLRDGLGNVFREDPYAEEAVFTGFVRVIDEALAGAGPERAGR